MMTHRISTVFGALAVAVALAAPAGAAETAVNTAPREFSAKLLVCNVCHGAAGAPTNGAVPIIWGQQEGYLLKQLHDFESKERNVEVMTWMTRLVVTSETGAHSGQFRQEGVAGKEDKCGGGAAPARNRGLPELPFAELHGRACRPKA
jgi:cytochrome c553